ncbi:MAG: threonine-phosphate decarboxylase CobD [Pseudomonadota bacterium]
MSDFIEHGGALDAAIAAHGGTRSTWLDLSTGINPVAYPVRDLPDDVWSALPDSALHARCLEAARAYYAVPDWANIVAAPGTQAIIQWLPYLLPKQPVSIISPTYGEYGQVFSQAAWPVETRDELVAISGEGIVIVGHPNNPDGRTWDLQACEAVLRDGATLIIDEAFADLVPDQSLVSLAAQPNVLVLKSFGKFFGMAGLRLGFAVGQGDLIGRLRTLLGPWSVAGPALAIGAQALADDEWIAQTRGQVRQQSAELERLLVGADCALVGRTDLFVTVSHAQAATIADGLARDHILVRRFDHSPDWLRFGLPGNATELSRLAGALQRVLP